VPLERPITGDAIRAAYLRFFEQRGHLLMPSASLIPAGDPTLLLTSAGMVPFKPYFTGDEEPPARRLTSVQKCFRTTDIDEVGDATHLTFFEMLGNFSIGDYFKKEAIAWAWDFVTQELAIPPERLWVTVFLDDDEAYDLWCDGIGVPQERIVRLGEKDNFWGPAGDEGPCGPSSELHYDLRPERGAAEQPGDDTDRFVEIWNLVFIQFYQHLDRSRTPLPAPSIDTGMGLDRTTAVLQGVSSVYETDIFQPIVQKVCEISRKSYGEDKSTDYAIRVVAEHARSATFLIAAGVTPGNEGRGYVLRRIIRRGIRFARKLEVEDPFLSAMAELVIERMGALYPELVEQRSFVLKALELEEERFGEAIADGLPLLERGLLPARDQLRNGENPDGVMALPVLVADLPDGLARKLLHIAEQQGGMEMLGRQVSGPEAFLLYDTYGFPLEMTQEIAREHGLTVDVDGFEAEMDAQRQRGRADRQFGADRDVHRTFDVLGVDKTPFLGYERLETETTVAALLRDGVPVERAEQGDAVEVVLGETPFYAEGGGQVGDTGTISRAGTTLTVRDTQRPLANVIAHDAVVTEGTLNVGDTVHVKVDAERRNDIMRNHTATHLLHQALREVLGTHVRQGGSVVGPERLRFDFTHVGAVTPQELKTIEQRVNSIIRGNLPADKDETTYREAIAGGALAFFGDRYPERVRTLHIGDFSYEVCGGTHVSHSGDIGVFRITSEGGIGTGTRRIEAVTGRGADAWLDERLGLLDGLVAELHATPQDARQRVEALMEEVVDARRESASSQRNASLQKAGRLLEQVEQVNGVAMLAANVPAVPVESLREMGDWLRDKMGSGIVVLGSVFSDRPYIVAMVTPDLVSKGYKAGDIVKVAAQRMGGGGGGRPEIAQAGGKEPDKLPVALEAAVDAVRGKEA